MKAAGHAQGPQGQNTSAQELERKTALYLAWFSSCAYVCVCVCRGHSCAGSCRCRHTWMCTRLQRPEIEQLRCHSSGLIHLAYWDNDSCWPGIDWREGWAGHGTQGIWLHLPPRLRLWEHATIPDFSYVLYLIMYVIIYLYMHMCLECRCLQKPEVSDIPWSWSYRWLRATWYRRWEPLLSPLWWYLYLKCWAICVVPPHQAFHMGVGDQSLVLEFAQQALHPWSYLCRPLPYPTTWKLFYSKSKEMGRMALLLSSCSPLPLRNSLKKWRSRILYTS